jgi:hypothetical protein
LWEKIKKIRLARNMRAQTDQFYMHTMLIQQKYIVLGFFHTLIQQK